jgi:hypothetical protein
MRRLAHALLAASAVLALSAPAAMAATPPVATTGGATSVSQSTATLNGTVNPEGQGTSYYFQYGTTTAYTSQTATTDAGSGTAAVNASAPLSSLAPATTYHYRLVATNPSGTTFGTDQSFGTDKPPPPVAITRTVKVVGATSATLRGIVNPKGEATSYFFEYGPTTAYGARTSTIGAGAGTTQLDVSAAIASLTPHTTYHYRLDATSTAGTTIGSDVAFTTVGGPAGVTIAASSPTIVFGQGTTISGKVLPPRPAHLTTVTLQSAATLAGPWVAHRGLTSVVNTQTGAYSFTKVTPSANTYYRINADGVYSPPLHVLVRFRVGVSVSNRNPSAGSPVHFRGRVAPAHRHLRIWIERLGHDGRWHIVKRARLRGLDPHFSFYSVRVRIAQAGLYRVVVKHDLDHAQGVSPTVRLRVH